MKKKIAELRQRRAALRKEARELAETPPEDLEANALEARLTAIEAELTALDARIRVLEADGDEGSGDDGTEGSGESVPAEAVPEGARARVESVREVRWGRKERRSGVQVDPELRTALVHYVKTGEIRGALSKAREQRNVVDTDSADVLIPLHVEAEVVTDIGDQVVMRQLGHAFPIPGNINLPVISGISKFKPVPENTDYPDVDVTIGGPQLRPLKIGGTTLISYEITRLAPHNAEEMIAEAMGEGRAENEDEMFIIGTGVEEPTGIVTAAPVAHQAAAAALTAQDFIALFYKVAQRYRNSGTWLMHSNTAAMLRGLEDSAGNPLWYPNLAGQPETLLGRPVVTSDYVPEIGAGKKSVLFGDFKEYRIGDREGMWIQVLREAYARKGQIGLQLTYFVDANLRRTRAVGAIQHA